MRNHFFQFLTDEQGGGALEFALVSAFAAFASLAAMGAVQNGQGSLLQGVHRQIIEAVGELNRALQ